MDRTERDEAAVAEGRRELLKALAAASGVVATRLILPAAWSAPILASMPLPAHAAMSSSTSQSVDPAAGSMTLKGSAPDGSAISAAVDSGTVTLTVTPPAALLQARTQYQVYERLTSDGTQFVRVVGLMTPSASAELSGSVKLALTRSSGKYEYQLRWIDGDTSGNTDWVSVNVP